MQNPASSKRSWEYSALVGVPRLQSRGSSESLLRRGCVGSLPVRCCWDFYSQRYSSIYTITSRVRRIFSSRKIEDFAHVAPERGVLAELFLDAPL
jgi:hypothetical protein